MGESLHDPLVGETPNNDADEEHQPAAAADGDASFVESGAAEGLLRKKTDSELDHSTDGKSSFWQTTVNVVNLVLGLGLLALPACVDDAGWLSLLLLLAFAIICCYTGLLFGRCMDKDPRLKSYHDIAEAAFGSWGRMHVTTFVCLEIAGYLIGLTISMGDNLAYIFPNATLELPWLNLSLKPSQGLVTIAVLVALPTTWMRDMSSLSFVSIGGVLTSFIVIGALAWAGAFGGVGFLNTPPRLNVANLPIVSGIYGYCYAEHMLLPTVYSGMKNPARFPQVLMLSFGFATVLFGGTAIVGATMFGQDTESPVTLSMPRNLLVAKIALWTAVLMPLTKFGLGIAPVANQIEAHLPFPRQSRTHRLISIAIRSSLLFAVLATALAFPSFHKMLALTGAAVSLSLAITIPAALHMKIFGASLSWTEIILGITCLVIGLFFTVTGTITSLKSLIKDFGAD